MRILYILLLLLWFVIGCFWCNRTFCGEANAAAAKSSSVVPVGNSCQPTLSFKIKGTDFSLISEENFKFQNSSDAVIDYSSDLDVILDDVSTYLKDNQNVRIQIKGMYASDEDNASGFENLGIARANAIKSIFLDKGVSVSQISTIGKPLTTNCFDDNVLQKGALVAFGSK